MERAGSPGCHCGATGALPGRQNLDELEFERGIWMAAKDGDLDKLKVICGRRGSDVNAADSYGYTALHYAARAGHVGVVRELLALGADVAQVTKGGATAAHRAAYCGQEEVLFTLIAHRSTLCALIADDDGDTIAHKAVKGGHRNLAEQLVLKYTELNEVRNNRGKKWNEV